MARADRPDNMQYLRPICTTLDAAVITNLEQTRALEARAQVVRTPCGAGDMVWHVWGPADGKPVVMLHGGSGSWTHWVRNIDTVVGRGYRAIVADMPGFGDSAPPPTGSDADALPPILEAGMRQVLGDQKMIGVGFSFGSLVNGLWLQHHPERYAGVVFVGGPSLTDNAHVRPTLRSWYHEPPGPVRDAILRENLLALMLAHETSLTEFALRVHEANVLRDRLRKRRMSMKPWLFDLVPTIACPVAGIYGSLDAAFPGRQLEKVETSLLRAPHFHSMTHVENAGHWVQFEDAPAFNAALGHFLDTAHFTW